MRMLIIGCSMDVRSRRPLSKVSPLLHQTGCAPCRVQLSSASDYAPAAYLADPPGDTSQWSSDSLPAPQAIKPSAIAAQVR